MNQRLTNPMIPAGQAYGANYTAPMLDLSIGGAFGLLPNFATYLSDTPYVSRPVQCRLISPPRGFQFMQNPPLWVAALKTLLELKSTTIDGLQRQYNVESIEVEYGSAGEKISVPKNVTQTQTQPSHGMPEKYGRPVAAFIDGWITGLIMDPYTKTPMVISTGASLTDLLLDYYSCIVLYFEPDPTHQYIQKAWLCGGMYPKAGVEMMGSKTADGGGEDQQIKIDFNAFTQYGYNVNQLAQSFLDAESMTGVNPNTQPAFAAVVDPDVEAATTGYADLLANAVSQAITP